MKNILFVTAIFLTSLAVPGAGAAPLIKVERPETCIEQDLCDEWRLPEMPGIRVAMGGYEDGVETSINRMERNGTHTRLIDVYPVVRDAAGRYWQGSADRIAGMPRVAEGRELMVWATFDHPLTDDGGNFCHPAWMRRVPVVLFEGERSPNDRDEEQQRRYRFVKMSLTALIALARKPSKKTEWVCVHATCCGGYARD